MITVIGLGFVGLTTALGLCSKGYKVYGVDINESKLQMIKNGKVPFLEPHLEEALTKYSNKNFFPTSDLKEAVEDSEYIFYCVGTPCDEEGKADLSYIFNAIKDTLKVVKKGEYKILIIKSTIPPSSTKNKIKPFIESLNFHVGSDIGLCNNPEFLREGTAWKDFVNPDRIVIGQCDNRSGNLVENLYKAFNVPIVRVSLNTGEFIKYLSNTLLSTMISFSNDMSMIASNIGDIDIAQAFNTLHLDKRWYGSPAGMRSYIYPGCGFGGYCLPKDTQALYSEGIDKGYKSNILQAVLCVNNLIKEFVVNKIIETTNKDDYIGILGLSFKPNSDDVRESPSKDIVRMLNERGYNKIVAYDPVANENFMFSNNIKIEYVDNMADLTNKVDNVVILTAWEEFKNNKDLLTGKNVLDFRYFI